MSSDRRRVFAPQALGADEYLRVTWHEGKRVVVFSQWNGSECTAAIPVRVNEVAELAGLLVDALGHEVNVPKVTWAPPDPASLVGFGPGSQAAC